MKEFFKPKKFRSATLDLIEYCEDILDEYAGKGYDLTLRQLYYQLVSRDVIPNQQSEYSRLGSIVNDARLAGLLDWDMIVDRGRHTRRDPVWTSPQELLASAAEQFRIDKWEDQPCHVEVMVEKQALEGVLIPVCSRLQVSFTANKGYSSQSFMYRKGKELKALRHKELHVLYLGDHDPSGLDMDRDVAERLAMFAENLNLLVNVHRVALTASQIQSYRPPPNPAKITDSRAREYIQNYGNESWELDALEPEVLADLVERHVLAYRDYSLWADALKEELEMRRRLFELAETWED